jgi:predicted DCC family thiol-disulfide oxidoreductase YuxK
VTPPKDRILLVYDRQCPLCEMYCTLSRIREAEGELVLVDARGNSEVMHEITAAGLDIDEGMVLKVGERLYYGSDAIHMLSLLGTRSGIFNRLTYWLFRSPRVAALLYPVLRFFRNLLLKLLGRSRINNLGTPGNDRF